LTLAIAPAAGLVFSGMYSTQPLYFVVKRLFSFGSVDEAEVSGAKDDGLCSEGTVGRESAKAAGADAEPDPPAPGVVSAVAGETFQEYAEQKCTQDIDPQYGQGH